MRSVTLNTRCFTLQFSVMTPNNTPSICTDSLISLLHVSASLTSLYAERHKIGVLCMRVEFAGVMTEQINSTKMQGIKCRNSVFCFLRKKTRNRVWDINV